MGAHLHAAGRIYYIEKISRRHGESRLLPERTELSTGDCEQVGGFFNEAWAGRII